jgi:deoxyribose-phosphate aldolase
MSVLTKPTAQYIDHTLLKPTAGDQDIQQLCEQAMEYGFYSVCVNGMWVSRCADLLRGTSVRTAAVVGFPLGASASASKAFEAQWAVKQGATEIDMVLPVGMLIAGNLNYVCADIREVVTAVQGQAIVKVILETGFLSHDQIHSGCLCTEEAGAHYVKTSTGFGPGGATEQHVAFMRSVVSETVGVKASGGIRDYDTAMRMIAAGASRLGTSAGVAIVQGASLVSGEETY